MTLTSNPIVVITMGDRRLEEKEIYKELGALTKDKTVWKENIPYVSSLLCHESAIIKAKALWLIGEMGLLYPDDVRHLRTVL